MPLPSALERRSLPHYRRVTRSAILMFGLSVFGVVCIPSSPTLGQNFGRRDDDKALTSGVYLPTERSLSRAMGRARERLAEKEYHQALTFLQAVLSRDEDTFLEQSLSGSDQQGLKATARQMIGELTPDGRKSYELLYSAAARRRLKAALAAGDQDGVALVVRQYFHTPAGYEAALVLAQMESDHGHYLAAAELYRELIETPQAAAQFEPQLSALAAANHWAAGEREVAEATLRSLFERYPAATIEIAGRQTSAPKSQADLTTWLGDLIGQPAQTAGDALDWLTLRGGPARNARPPGGAPHLRTRWQARVVNDPTIETYLTSREEQLTQRGGVAIPSARPIAVGDVVLMRTPYNVVAVDWHTGQRVWETREEDELIGDRLVTDSPDGGDSNDFTVVGRPLEQRVWDDSLVTSLASDGERAFVIRALMTGAQNRTFRVPGAQRMFNGMMAGQIANELVAYDLATQGKLLWELDGSRANGPLAGAFFFGTPLAIDNTLYVMAEIRSAVYLMALEPRTGEVRWQQQLVGLEQGIGLDPSRRTVAAMPSYAGGILVCPTSAGAAVAIDVVKREFAWVYRYPREVSSPADMRQLWPQQRNSPRTTNRWRDNVAIIDDGRVFLTAPESAELYCLDLRTGSLQWKRPKGDALFVACVDDGRVLLAGKDSVRALRAEDGTPLWANPLQLPEGAQPSGDGYMSEGRYYLPVTTGGVVAVELKRGKILAPTSTEPKPVLGNLIWYRDSVLSQTALVLDKYEQRDVLRERAETALAKNANDATALRQLAEIMRVEGKTRNAVRQLKRAVELAPDDPLAKEMLAEMLLDSLSTDFVTYRGDVPLLRQLIRDREQEVALLQIEAQGLVGLGERLAALDAYLRLVDFTAESPAELQISPEVQVRSDRWVSGQLANLWDAALPEERAEIAKRIDRRRPDDSAQPTAAALRHYLAHFGVLPGADAVRLQLARWLVDRRRAREAEIVLLQLAASPDSDARRDAARLRAKLQTQYDVAEMGTWPRGLVEARVDMPAGSAEDQSRQRAKRENQRGLRRLPVTQDVWPASDSTQWFVSADGTQLIGRNGLGDDILHLAVDQSNQSQQGRDAGFLHAARLGRLAVLSVGTQIAVVDSREFERGAGGEVLWQATSMGRFRTNISRRTTNRRRVVVFDAWSGRSSRVTAAATGSLGPVTPGGIVFEDRNVLKCVDPLSGETLWMRTDVPAGCELFGDGELVLAADAGERKAHVFRMLDGQRLEERELPDFPWMMVAGRNVAQREIRGGGRERKMHLRVTDVQAENVLLNAEYDDQSQMTVVEPNSLAVYEPSGHFQLIDVRTGRIQIDEALRAMPDLQSIRSLVSGNQLFLLVSGRSLSKENQPITRNDPLINGFVYAFDLEEGTRLWPGPAVVRNRGIVRSQPADIPLLVFVDRQLNRRAIAGRTPRVRLLCLDKNTGRTVYRNDELRLSTVSRLRVRAERQATPTVVVEMNGAEVYLTATERPRPPQPPANDDLEMPRTSAERGLMEVGRRMVGVVQEALENQPGGRNRRPRNRPIPEQMDDD
jgi:outer membrane protein assembly factor BamB/tetratricopeptide (TPR) repeat protein